MRGASEVRTAESAGDVNSVRELWREHWKSIGVRDKCQGFGEELKGLPGLYGAEAGALLIAVVERARAIGNQALYADSLPRMTEALSLYERIGFEKVKAYASDPTPGAIFLNLNLT